MLKKLLLPVFLCLPILLFSQDVDLSSEESHETFLKQLDGAKEISYSDILSQYDRFIKATNGNINAEISKCKFIGTAYYDEYEDYDENYEETEICRESLLEKYPNNAKVLLYNLEYYYGDARQEFILRIFKCIQDFPSNWIKEDLGNFYEIVAKHYSDIDPQKTLDYARKAERNNKELDLSLLVAQTLYDLGDEEEAREEILGSLFYDHEPWVLNQKASLLVKLGETDEATKLYDRVRVKDSSYINTDNIYTLLVQDGKYEQARQYLVDDTIAEWNKTFNLQKLAGHDSKYSDVNTAIQSYRLVQATGSNHDYFGLKRAKLMFQKPFEPLNFRDTLQFFRLWLLILILFVIPFLWIMPIYGAGAIFGLRKQLGTAHFGKWNLKHFWWLSFLYLVIQVAVLLIFYHDEYVNYYFNSDNMGFNFAEDSDDDIAKPLEIIVFTLISFVGIIFFLNKRRFIYTFHSKYPILKMIAMSIAFVVFNGILLRILGNVPITMDGGISLPLLNLRPEILGLLNSKGFFATAFLVAVLVPIYEEIMFRGIMLSAIQSHLGFTIANVIQAALFSLGHFNVSLFIFYFSFGMITGYIARRSNGLLTGIIFHAVNNFLVVVVLYAYANTFAGS